MAPDDWVKYRDKDGTLVVDWVEEVTDHASAEAYVKKKGGTLREYIGKSGTIENAYINEDDVRTGYYLNDDITITKAGEAKPSITIPDVANSEFTIDVAAAVAGGLGVWSSTMEEGIDMARRTGEMIAESHPDGSLKIMEKANDLGGVEAIKIIQDPNSNGGQIAGAISKVVFKSIMATAKINPIVSVALAVSDITGLTDLIFKW